MAGVEANEISLKLQKTLLTRWWHVNVCATQVMTSYEAWVKLFEDLHISWQGNRTRSMNSVALGKSKKLK